MIDLQKRIDAFTRLGEDLRKQNSPKMQKLISESVHYNGWFTEDMVKHMLLAIGESLQEQKINKWLNNYLPELENKRDEKTIGVVMAGNIPAVGFHDFLSVLISGNKLKAKLSSDDNKHLPAIADLLTEIEPGLSSFIEFSEDRLLGFDAIIATGSTNTSRYFDYYFGKYPNIIHKNRNGVAVLSGDESGRELNGLADDIFLFYGLGCRNVSKLYVPENYDFTPLFQIIETRKKIAENHKYFNNYEYNKAIYLINSKYHFDTGNLLLVEEEHIASPVSVVYFEYYSNPEILQETLVANTEKIQCIVSHSNHITGCIPFGKSQQPELWEYADRIDTIQFLLGLE